MTRFILSFLFSFTCIVLYSQEVSLILQPDLSTKTAEGNDFLIIHRESQSAKDLYDQTTTHNLTSSTSFRLLNQERAIPELISVVMYKGHKHIGLICSEEENITLNKKYKVSSSTSIYNGRLTVPSVQRNNSNREN